MASAAAVVKRVIQGRTATASLRGARRSERFHQQRCGPRERRGRCARVGAASFEPEEPDEEPDEEDIQKVEEELGEVQEEMENLDIDDSDLLSLFEEAQRAVSQEPIAGREQEGYEAEEGEEEEPLPFFDEEEAGMGVALDGEEEDEKEEDEEVHSKPLLELLEDAGLDWEWIRAGQGRKEVFGIAYKCEDVMEGDLFVCTRAMWAPFDGHEEAKEAVRRGAVAVVAEREIFGLRAVPIVGVRNGKHALGRLAAALYGRPSERMVTVGVTGSLGKTSTCYLVKAILEEHGKDVGLLGSLAYEVGNERLTDSGDVWEPIESEHFPGREATEPGWLAPRKGQYDPPDFSTPDAVSSHQLLSAMVSEGAEAAVMEASGSGMAEERLEEVDFDVCCMTNVSPGMMTKRHDFSAYLGSKVYLFYSKLLDPLTQRGVVNLDDPSAEYFVSAAGDVLCLTYSRENENADVYLSRTSYSLFETELTIATPLGPCEILTPLIGSPHAANILAAVSVGLTLRVPLTTIKAGIESVVSIPGRMEMIDLGQPYSVIVDSAKTPDELARVFQSARDIGANRIITVVSGEGNEKGEQRPLIGRVAHQLSDVVFVTTNNPRYENQSSICDDVVRGFEEELYEEPHFRPLNFRFMKDMYRFDEVWHRDVIELQDAAKRYVVEDRALAIRGAICMAQEQDAVIIAGKGHEDFMEVNGERYWFDDRREARHVLETQKQVYDRANGELQVDMSKLPWTQYEPANRVSLLDIVKDARAAD